jgi:arsenate reductase (thioredoxin)
MSKPSVLVICTGNSMRSQLAEGLLHTDLGAWIDVYSAGTHPSFVHPLTIKALQEIGIETSHLRSKSVKEFIGRSIDLVITVCDSAHEACPFFPGARKLIHQGYPDPVSIRPGADLADVFSELRDQMRRELRDLVVKELNLPVPS